MVKKGIQTCCYFKLFHIYGGSVCNWSNVAASGCCFCATAEPAQISSIPGFTGRPQSDYGTIRRYLVCGACLLAQRASWGPLTVGAGGRGCQFRRDALGAPLPPRARQTRAEPAALHVRNPLLVRHRHLQGGGSLSGAQTYRKK